jgi:hypothetical protein
VPPENTAVSNPSITWLHETAMHFEGHRRRKLVDPTRQRRRNSADLPVDAGTGAMAVHGKQPRPQCAAVVRKIRRHDVKQPIAICSCRPAAAGGQLGRGDSNFRCSWRPLPLPSAVLTALPQSIVFQEVIDMVVRGDNIDAAMVWWAPMHYAERAVCG